MLLEGLLVHASFELHLISVQESRHLAILHSKYADNIVIVIMIRCVRLKLKAQSVHHFLILSLSGAF
ncbi:hypothetical protein CPB84DRAFT_1772783 [Gymnopilus junonius]|uniref:Uncharacterized protein n=1 Tax=Gymnopilus junonius TaxID=109634 RepID=A0A9P5NSD2_GYMJU|nr:hypothetical protein CPB84DRAFT_1772783 [Gymnopilus junonius]